MFLKIVEIFFLINLNVDVLRILILQIIQINSCIFEFQFEILWIKKNQNAQKNGFVFIEIVKLTKEN